MPTKSRGRWLELSAGNKRRSLTTWLGSLTKRRWPASSEAVFRYMNISRPEVRVLYSLFVSADVDDSGQLGVCELMTAVGLEHSDFANRVFCMKDHVRGVRASGACDFEAFAVSAWCLCALSEDCLSFFCFELYDSEKSGYLSMEDFKRLVVDMSAADFARTYGATRLLQDFRTHCSESPYDGMSKLDFDLFCSLRPLLLAPAHQLRRRVRRKFGGDAFWNAIGSRREFSDRTSHTSIALAVLRSLLVDDDDGVVEVEDRPRTAEVERHRARKLKRRRVDAAVGNRTASTATRHPNPVVTAFQQRKFLAVEMIDELAALGRATDLPVPLDYLADADLTKNMRRPVSLEDEQQAMAVAKARVLKWMDFTAHIDDVADDADGESLEFVRRKAAERKEEVDVVRPETPGDAKGDQQATLARQKQAKRRWHLIQYRAKDARARASVVTPTTEPPSPSTAPKRQATTIAESAAGRRALLEMQARSQRLRLRASLEKQASAKLEKQQSVLRQTSRRIAAS